MPTTMAMLCWDEEFGTNERMVSSFLLNDAWHLIAGTSFPDEYFGEHMLDPPD